MADKITNFEDYVKNQSRNSGDQTPPVSEEIKQETMEIQIEDPFQFLNEQEREEYILHRREEQNKDPKKPSEPMMDKGTSPDASARPPRDGYGDDYEDDYPDDEADEPHRGFNMELFVRIASIITGVLILVIIGLILKIKVYDVYFAPDPDNAAVVAIALPEGFVQRDDYVVVKDATSLNLRLGPGTESTIVTAVAEGTQLRRIAVSEDDSWALIEYDGQQLYASMKYLEVQ